LHQSICWFSLKSLHNHAWSNFTAKAEHKLMNCFNHVQGLIPHCNVLVWSWIHRRHCQLSRTVPWNPEIWSVLAAYKMGRCFQDVCRWFPVLRWFIPVPIKDCLEIIRLNSTIPILFLCYNKLHLSATWWVDQNCLCQQYNMIFDLKCMIKGWSLFTCMFLFKHLYCWKIKEFDILTY
jgi:hypothetical protein